MEKNKTINGWLNIDKPLNYSSAKVVAIVKKLLNAKKVGHGGTLDPLATGVLPICINNSTKTTERVMQGKKTYLFEVLFGEERSTDDMEGEIINSSDIIPGENQIKSILNKFIGQIKQTPPIYSAIKVDGKRAYDLARCGNDFILNERIVEVDNLKFNGFTGKKTAEFIVECGKGFYVRSLARDIGRELGTFACISRLRRLKVGAFTIENSITLDDLEKIVKENEIDKYLLIL